MDILKTSESLKSFAPAFLKAQKKMESAKKDSNNPFFKSTYADLGSVLSACKPQLNDEGIGIIQAPGVKIEGDNVIDVIVTRLLHESGEFMEVETRTQSSKSNDPQSKLAGETYTRRGSLQSFVSLPAEDDDGNAASGNTYKKPAAKKPAGRPPKKDKPEEKPAAEAGADKDTGSVQKFRRNVKDKGKKKHAI